MSKLLLITQYFPPENGAAAERMRSFALFLNQYFNVEVVTAQPRLMVIDEEIRSSDYPFTIVRIPHNKKSSSSKYQRVMHEILFTIKTIRMLLGKKEIPLTLYSTPSPFLAIAALILNKVQGRPYLLDVRDLYPEVIADSGLIKKTNFVYKFAAILMATAYSNAQLLTYVNKNWSEQMFKANQSSMYLPNGISDDVVQSDELIERQDQILYSGNFGRMYDFDPILEIAKRLQESNDEQLQKISIILIGDGVQVSYLAEKIKELELGNVTITGPFNKTKVSRMLKYGKIGIVSLNLEAKSLKGAMPNKLFDYMQAGLKTIAIIPEKLSSEIMETGLISVHTKIDYKKLILEIKGMISDDRYPKVSTKLYPFLYREYHLKIFIEKIFAARLNIN